MADTNNRCRLLIAQGSIAARFGRLASVITSSLVFAAAHGVPILLPYMVVLGVTLALLREFYRNLWAPLAMHCILNTIASSAILSALIYYPGSTAAIAPGRIKRTEGPGPLQGNGTPHRLGLLSQTHGLLQHDRRIGTRYVECTMKPDGHVPFRYEP